MRQQGTCQALLDAKARQKRKRVAGNAKPVKKERRSKERVVGEAIAKPEGFAKAKAIFATNAVKYHVNKLRAKEWAASHGQQVYYAIAKDRISSRALCEKSQTSARTNWRGCNGTIKTAEPCTERFTFMHWYACHGHRPSGPRPWNLEEAAQETLSGWKLASTAKDDGERRGQYVYLEQVARVHFRSFSKRKHRGAWMVCRKTITCFLWYPAKKAMAFGQRPRKTGAACDATPAAIGSRDLPQLRTQRKAKHIRRVRSWTCK